MAEKFSFLLEHLTTDVKPISCSLEILFVSTFLLSNRTFFNIVRAEFNFSSWYHFSIAKNTQSADSEQDPFPSQGIAQWLKHELWTVPSLESGLHHSMVLSSFFSIFKMRRKMEPAIQGCCEDQRKACTESLRHGTWAHRQPLIHISYWCGWFFFFDILVNHAQ